MKIKLHYETFITENHNNGSFLRTQNFKQILTITFHNIDFK